VTNPSLATFRRDPRSRLLTPDAPGLADLIEAIDARESIWMTGTSDHPVQARPGAPQVLCCQTAGSSGAPKIIRRSPASWIASFEVNADLFAVSPNDRYAVLGTLSHSLALYGVMEALHCGADVASFAGLRPRQQLDALDDAGITVLYATPAQLRLLLTVGSGSARDLRLVLAGGGKLDAVTRAELPRIFPKSQVIEFFGASETSFVSISDETTPEDSVGRPYPGVSLRIDQDGPGEIWVSGPYLFDGYADDSPANWQGQYLSIGEMGYQDAAGNLFLAGRKSRMFTVADSNVFPEVIERFVTAQSGVRAAVVLPRPEALRGHVPVCFVEADGTDGPALIRLCRDHLRPVEMPREVVFLDRLPLLRSGKPDLEQLRRLLERT